MKLFTVNYRPVVFLVVVILVAAVQGSATAAKKQAETLIQSGDTIYMEYTCYRKDRAMVFTTDPEKEKFAEKKADIFLPQRDPGPVQMTAGSHQVEQIHTMTAADDFEHAIASYLAQAIVNEPYEKMLTVEIGGEVQKNISDSERYLKLNRHQIMDRKKWVGMEEIKTATGKAPAVGDKIPLKEATGVLFVITKLDGDKALMEIEISEGAEMKHAFGRKRFINIDHEKYDIVIDTEKGRLIRSGDLVGRVSEVGDQSFTMDYGHPFGGESFVCDVKAALH
jgi:FKBP-type peptidyl-prolyl cis-trans isomerase 2